MQTRFIPSMLSLRVKLVLSYILVTLGAILILTVAVALAVEQYVKDAQIKQLNVNASFQAKRIAGIYHRASVRLGPGNGTFRALFQGNALQTNDPDIIIVIDDTGYQVLCVQPEFITKGSCDEPQLKQALLSAARGIPTSGYLNTAVGNTPFSSLYVSVPISDDGQVVGALLLSQPQLSADKSFFQQVNSAIIIAGILVALVVAVASFLLTRGLTRPLESLTVAAEQMKRGKYTQRVAVPKTQDELGLLALTFNEMADTIEADVNELKRQEQARRDLIANIAHDLATPLTAIQGFSEALADDMLPDVEARHETAQRIAREVQRLRRLVADVQQMTSMESGHVRLDLAPLDLRELVSETLAVIEPECEAAGITLENYIDSAQSMVVADSDRITQVLLNLLDNARRHTPCGGTICVSAMQQGSMLIISIQDTGTGIDPAHLPHIFERFYRADRSRTGTTGGSGLGLAIVKAIITAHGGSVWAVSKPGQGMCIGFSLPLAHKNVLEGSHS